MFKRLHIIQLILFNISVFFVFGGILAFAKPCGIVVGIREMFGSGSKSQVYSHLHSLFASGKLSDVIKFYT